MTDYNRDFREDEFAADLGISSHTLRKARITGILLGKPAPKFRKLGPARNSPVTYSPEARQAFKAQFNELGSTGDYKGDGK